MKKVLFSIISTAFILGSLPLALNAQAVGGTVTSGYGGSTYVSGNNPTYVSSGPTYVSTSPVYVSPTYTSTGYGVSSACINLPTDLYIGVGGGSVTSLQNFLISEGYFHYTATGFFGSLTVQAVRQFQAANGISSTGYVGPYTRARIVALSCGSVSPSNPITPVIPTGYAPIVSSVSTSNPNPGQSVTVYGSNFSGSNTILISGNIIQGVYSSNGTSLNFVAPYISSGNYTLSVQNAYGTSNGISFSIGYNYNNGGGNNYYGTPVISYITPTYGPTGTLVTVYGSNFSTYNNSINFGGTNSIITGIPSYNGTSLQFSVPSTPCVQGSYVCSQLAYGSGSFNLSVNNQYGTSNSVMFQITGYNGGGGGNIGNPSISYLTPTSGSIGSSVTVYGSGFTSDNTVNFGGGVVQHVYSSNGTSLTFTVPSSLNPACYYSYPQCLPPTQQVTAGNYLVSIQNSNGTSNQLTFQVTGGSNNSNPTINYITPTSGPIGTYVTVYGSGFTSTGNAVQFGNGYIQNLTSNDGNTLTFTIPSSEPVCRSQPGQISCQALVTINQGTYNISVINGNNAVSTGNTPSFTVTGGSGIGNINQTLMLSVNQTGYAGSLGIDPLSIVEDSRCAAGVYCIQAGRVVVSTYLFDPNINTTVNIDSSGSGYTTSDGYTIRITGVSPFKPQGGQTIPSGSYQITYQVTK